MNISTILFLLAAVLLFVVGIGLVNFPPATLWALFLICIAFVCGSWSVK